MYMATPLSAHTIVSTRLLTLPNLGLLDFFHGLDTVKYYHQFGTNIHEDFTVEVSSGLRKCQ